MAAMNLRSTRTEFDARRLIVELGGSLKAAWTRALGREPNSANFAQVGDLVLMDLPGGGGSVGICCGRDAVYLDAAGGLARLPMTLASHAWKIGGAAC